VPQQWPNGVDVLAIDLDLRGAAAGAARDTVREAAAMVGGQARLYVKIDSTLRGPVAALVEGALEGSRLALALVAPAFADHLRVYRQGRLGGYFAVLHDVLGTIMSRCRIFDHPGEVEPDEDALLVGSGGLARRLAGAPAQRPLPRASGPVLVVAGSPAVETQRQLEQLPARVDVLRTAPTTERDAGEAAALLAQAVANRGERPGLVVLTGGQTARLTCQALGVRAIDLLGEVQPGIPVGRLIGGMWHDALVVTKAGGFGGPSALLDALRLVGPSSLHST